MAAGLVVLLALARSGLDAPEPTLLLQDRDGRFLGELGATGSDDEELGYWPLESLPPRVVAATLAIEDRRFWRHPGVDPLAAGRALRQLLESGKRVSGASTLAMQVARMQNPGPRGYLRKGLEALTALLLTARNGRERVLAHYLRIVPYGNRIHGIGYAARRYLDKPVEDLSWAEVAFLTALPQAPSRMNPFDPAGRLRAVERGKRILDALLARGALSRGEHAVAIEQIPELRVPARQTREPSAVHALLRLKGLLSEPEERRALRTHPVVRTTLDLEIQKEAAWKTFEAVRGWEARGAGNGAVIVADRNTLSVLAWVGSTDYFDARSSGAIDFTSVERSPGSTLKPFLYALALERGLIGPATVLDDLHRASGGITNADESYLGPMLPKVALANSRNVPAANLLATIGIGEAFGFLAALRLHDGMMPARHYGLEMAIGGMPTTLAGLVRAYGVLSGDGRLRELRWFPGQRQTVGPRLISEDTARHLTLFLSDDMARLPSFPRLGATEYPFPVAVKTGTSSGYRDAWTVAYSARHLVGVWIGHPGARPMNRLSGYRSAARLAQSLLLHLHGQESDGLRKPAFPPPRGYQSRRVCGRTGKLATPACDQVFLEWFRPGQEPADPCAAHQRLPIDTRDGLAASEVTPPEFVELRTFTDLDPRYAAWTAAAGIPRPPSRGRTSGPGGTGLTGPGSPEAPASVTRQPEPSLRISSPEDGERMFPDPEMPPDRSTLLLQVVVKPAVPQVVWYVDGEPFQTVDYPYTAHWQLRRGQHSFQARVPFMKTASPPVRVTVQ